ncbi:MAG: hypothetical protein AAFQ71_15720, partial [Planctomycetota bacterium]
MIERQPRSCPNLDTDEPVPTVVDIIPAAGGHAADLDGLDDQVPGGVVGRGRVLAARQRLRERLIERVVGPRIRVARDRLARCREVHLAEAAPVAERIQIPHNVGTIDGIPAGCVVRRRRGLVAAGRFSDQTVDAIV